MFCYFTFIWTIFYQKTTQNRHFLFITLLTLLSTIFVVSSANADQNKSSEDKNNKKILIVYYSRTGNTDFIAKQIHEQIGGDVIKLETVEPYPEQYRATTIQARKELEADFRPALKNQIDNIADYDLVFIGSPNWWGTMSMPIRTFLYSYDLSGKTIALFITHEGSGLGRCMDDLKKFIPNATILDGIAIRGGSVQNSQKQIQEWLTNIDIR